MATTVITDHTAIPGVPSTPSTNGRLIANLQDKYASAQRDADVATDPEDGAYYAGLIDAYHDALDLLTDCIADGHCASQETTS